MTKGDAMTTRSPERDAIAARQLRVAYELVDHHAPDGRDKTDALRRIGLMVANLTRHDTTRLCRRCGQAFSFRAEYFAARHLDEPRHCWACRQARRQERARAGITRTCPQRSRDLVMHNEEMAMMVPSEIVVYIDSRVPAAKNAAPFPLGQGHAAFLSNLLRYLDALPAGIVTLKGAALTEYDESVEAIRTAVEAWNRGHGNTVCEKIPDGKNVNPLTYLRTHIASLPDSVVSPTTTELTFLSGDPALRDELRSDVAAADRSFGVADWKGCTVLCGSVVEALLLWALNEHETKYPGQRAGAVQTLLKSKIFSKAPAADPNEWNLNQLTAACQHLGIIGDETAAQCGLARKFRNLIHPGRAARLAQTCTRGTALSALAAVEHVAEDLT